ncbi:MAG: hypothetical protein LLG05_17835 [Porphyromonadaceae bacterium]|nr:hypothetical protein [Porphyromonadaceae bacterium]
MNTIEKPVVHGPIDHNAFAVLGAASKALRKAGQGDRVKEMMDKATSGDYNHLLSTVMEYVDFDFYLSNPEEDPDWDEDDDDEEDEWKEEDEEE